MSGAKQLISIQLYNVCSLGRKGNVSAENTQSVLCMSNTRETIYQNDKMYCIHGLVPCNVSGHTKKCFLKRRIAWTCFELAITYMHV